MTEIKGNFNTAKVFTNQIDERSIEQITLFCNQEFTQGAKIRLMPDVHAGNGCTIGTTMTIKDKIVPNIVGVDIGCGMETLVIDKNADAVRNFNPEQLDKIIRNNIPCGFDIRDFAHDYVSEVQWDKVKAKLDVNRAKLSLGTLGGGNHFVEVDKDDEGNMYIVVHSGSRHAGCEIAQYYQDMAWKQLNHHTKKEIYEMIQEYKAAGREKEIETRHLEMRNQIVTTVPKELAYVSGDLFDDYINDMKIMQHFAMLNRKAMIKTISIGLHLKQDEIIEQFTTIHNYIDTESMILRKGAVSAKAGEKLLIPMNMRDGSLICIGKGNEDWNFSAPHGAGRIMSRSKAKYNLSITEFKKQMEGIFSTTVNEDTLDESPMAYKPMETIIQNISPTVDIVKVIKPIYNYKGVD